MRQYLSLIKSKAGVLQISVNRLSSEYETAKNILIKTLEEIRFISPVNNGVGDELELNIIRSLNTISELLNNTLSASIPGVVVTPFNPMVEREVIELQSLVSQRKLIRN